MSELVEYHCARGAFSTEPTESAGEQWMGAATAAVPVEANDEYALVAAGSPLASIAASWRISATAGTSPPTRSPGRRGRERPPAADASPAVRRRRRRHLRQPAGRRTAVTDRHLGGRRADSGCGAEENRTGIAGPARFRDPARRRGTRHRHRPVRVAVRRARHRQRPGRRTTRRTRVATVDRLRGVAARLCSSRRAHGWPGCRGPRSRCPATTDFG